MAIATGSHKAINNQSRFAPIANQPLAGMKKGELTWLGGRLIVSDPNARQYINDGYLGNDTVYSIITQTATKFASIPLYVYKIKDKKALNQYQFLMKGDLRVPGTLQKAMDLRKKALEEADELTPLAKLLKHPNEREGQSEFLQKAMIYKASTGGAPIYVNRGGVEDGEPIEMENLPGQYLQVQGDGTLFGVSRYVILTTDISLDKSEVMYWKYPNPDFHPSGYHLYGLSPLRAGAMVLQASNDGLRAMVAMFQNGGARGVLYDDSGADALTPEEVSRLQEVTDYKVNNLKAKGKVVATGSKVGYINIGLDSVDMELLKAMDLTSARMCNLFNFPPGLLNPNSTYDNRQQDMKFFITNKIVPEWNSFRDELNNTLIPMYNGKMDGYFCDYDISELPEMQDDFSKVSAVLSTNTWLSPNEKRLMTRHDPIDSPEMNTVYVPNTQIPIKEAFDGMGMALPAEVVEDGKKDIYPE